MSVEENEIWKVQEHVIPAAYPRGYHRGVRDPIHSRLRLHVKQYIVRSSVTTKEDDTRTPLTIIFAHGVGSSKESYEPLLSSLVTHPSSPPIRHIFSLDFVDNGRSYLLNQTELGDAPHWSDIARDLLQLVNHFQADMTVPLVGISQSAGAHALFTSASWSPRLFQALVCIEPVVENGFWHWNEGIDGSLPVNSSASPTIKKGGRDYTGVLAFLRRDVWPTFSAAEKTFRRSPYYSGFDESVLQKVLQYDLRPINHADPTGPATLVTPSFLEASHFMRLDPPIPGQDEVDHPTRTLESQHLAGFFSPGAASVRAQMASISARVLYVWAPENAFTNAKYHKRVIAATGTGVEGGGGLNNGQVDETVVEKGRHTLPLDNPAGTARKIAEWLGGRWWQEWQQAQGRWMETVQIGKDTDVWAEWARRISKL
ncbi:MAG: hypothetical protein Q9160_004129 [Pyrenula sp. 1 TL-2023]